MLEELLRAKWSALTVGGLPGLSVTKDKETLHGQATIEKV